MDLLPDHLPRYHIECKLVACEEERFAGADKTFVRGCLARALSRGLHRAGEGSIGDIVLGYLASESLYVLSLLHSDESESADHHVHVCRGGAQWEHLVFEQGPVPDARALPSPSGDGLYLVGGRLDLGAPTNRFSFMRLRPEAQARRPLRRMCLSRRGCGVCLCSRSQGGRGRGEKKRRRPLLYVVGGYDEKERPLRCMETYDLEENEWSLRRESQMPLGGECHAFLSEGGKALICVVCDRDHNIAIQRFEIGTGRWSLVSQDDVKGVTSVAVVMAKQHLFVIGGYLWHADRSFERSRDIKIFDLQQRKWLGPTPATMRTRRLSPSAAYLPSRGVLMVAGGANSYAEDYKEVEIFRIEDLLGPKLG